MNGLLFIDDEEGIRRSVARALKQSRYEVFLASNAETGMDLARANRHRISTVISDYKMPGQNGMAVLAAIGEMNPETIRILLTGYATMDVAIAATNEGLDGFLTKPFDNKELRSKLHEITLKKRLKQFVPESIYKKIQSDPDALSPTYHDVTVLFVDIRGFTSMSQDIQPEKIASFLNNHFFSPFGEIADQFNGTVDKHMGDSIMVSFGSLVPRPDDARCAVHTAVSMQRRAAEIDQHLLQSNGFRMQVGIGISTGKVFSGLLGSIRKKEFTCVGHAVNVAARLERMAGPGEILISDATFQEIA